MLSGILAELSADDVSLLVERFTERTYEPGERIITSGAIFVNEAGLGE